MSLGTLNKYFYLSNVLPENWHLLKSHQWKEILFSQQHVKISREYKTAVLTSGLRLDLAMT